MDPVTLPPDLQRFAEEAVAAGRFQNLAEVAAAGVALLRQQDAEQAVAAFEASLDKARAEADRDGWVTLEEMSAEMRRIVEEADAHA